VKKKYEKKGHVTDYILVVRMLGPGAFISGNTSCTKEHSGDAFW